MKRKTQNNNCCKFCPKNQKQVYEINTTEELLSLMNIYYTEWSHRDSLMRKQVCTFFFAVFIIILLPFIKIWDITLADIIPHVLFPIAGIALSFVFLYITIQYANRLSKSSETCRELIERLPEEFKRKSIYEKQNITKSRQLAYTVPIIMFSALIIFAIIILILCLIN